MRCIPVTLLLALLAGCAASTRPAATQPSAGVPINKYCAVEQTDPVDPKVPTTVYKGQTIGFCCPDCIGQFNKNPEKYMATLK